MTRGKQFNSLPPQRKKLIIWAGVGVVLLVLVTAAYQSRTEGRKEILAQERAKEIQLEPDLIQKTMLREQRRQLDQLQKSVMQLQKEQERQKARENAEKALPPIPTPEELAKNTEQEALVNTLTGINAPPPPQMQTQGTQQQSPHQMIGAITVLSNENIMEQKTEGDKKKEQSVYLPPSFMEAQLLTGFDASTSGTGLNNPEPLLLRIQTPAVLPNDVKANLSGCFVIAEAVGRLDKERADVRLVSLSCLSNKGKAVIDTPVKGFITDSDSKVGLAGRVVSRMGAATARTIVAGFFDGMGDMLKSAATTQSTSALGTTSSVKAGEVAKYSLGGGLSEGARSLHDFYLDLAKQATPVIEVGATKQITVVISEGKELEIRTLEEEKL